MRRVIINFVVILLILLGGSSCASNTVTKSTAGLGQLSEANPNGIRFRFYEAEYELESCNKKDTIQLRSKFNQNELGIYEFAMISSADEEKDKFSVFNFDAAGLKHPYHQRVFVRGGESNCKVKISLSIVPIMDSVFVKDICEQSNTEGCERVKKEGLEDIEKFVKLVESDTGFKLKRLDVQNSFIYYPNKDSWLRSCLKQVGYNYNELIRFSPVRILSTK